MSNALCSSRIAFLGAGSIAEAIIRGLITNGGVPGDHIWVSNRSNTARLEELKQAYGVHYSSTPEAHSTAIQEADLIFAAFKPKDAAEGLRTLKPLLREGQLLISVIAGLSIATMQDLLADAPAVVSIARTMPNTSSSIGLGATGISFCDRASAQQRATVQAVFESTGMVSVVDEPLLETITGLSGSGPAYIYYMMEAMIEGGIRGGLPAEEARRLTVQTVLGAARMVELTGEEPAELRRKVTSPNGATQASIEALDAYGFPEAVRRAVIRSSERAREMGEAINASAASESK